MRTTLFIMLVGLLLQPMAAQNTVSTHAGPESKLVLESSDTRLVQSFDWAKKQALAFAFEGDPVGDWYEAALPGRRAFCMRDTSHQAMGAHALGLARYNHNMLRRFAENISEARDWCSLWEIDGNNRPAHADYRNDSDFWYNLPANFDVVAACYRMYLWSGDMTYINDPVFLNFYDRTMTDYIDRWDLNLDKVMKRQRIMNQKTNDADSKFGPARGIPGYNEENGDFVVGIDLLATQYRAYLAYARIQEVRGNMDVARLYLKRAADLKAFVNREWWDEKNQSFYDRLGTDYRLIGRKDTFWNIAELYWTVAEDGPKAKAAVNAIVEQIKRNPSIAVETQSHHAEILYRYGVPDVAYLQMMDLARQDRSRREYPEVSYSVIGAIVTGLMGVSVDPVVTGKESDLLEYFGDQFVMTVPQLTNQTAWAELRNLPIRANEVSVRHEGLRKTIFTNQSGPTLIWRAALPGSFEALLVNGKRVKATRQKLPLGRQISWVRVVVAPGNVASVEAPK